MTIGAVLDALKPDFPDVTISKIRFLEAEGLVTPERTASGYRTFSDDDVERLRYILSAQRDRFWPLKVIRESLDALDRGLAPADRGRTRCGPRHRAPRPTLMCPRQHPARSRALRLTRAELGAARTRRRHARGARDVRTGALGRLGSLR